ncbi:triose-phosphate isomerase [Microbacterium sp.]|uniref:triose-phosphate isomerase n=1 Tax=Microbacterium sp. TaxID=51671 RepID=UPI003A897DB1
MPTTSRTTGQQSSRSSVVGAPFFEFGPKNLLRIDQIVEIAVAADRAGRQEGVSVIITVPTALIAPLRVAVPGVFVFAQGMDLVPMGASVGRVTAESLIDAGAHGVMLNHDSNPLSPDGVALAVARASDTGLMTMVCAESDTRVLELAAHEPTIVLYEPPALIGRAESSARPWIGNIDAQMRRIAPSVLMMHAGGVSAPDDAYQIMRAGAAGTGSTSAIAGSSSPGAAVVDFIEAVRRGYDDCPRTL